MRGLNPIYFLEDHAQLTCVNGRDWMAFRLTHKVGSTASAAAIRSSLDTREESVSMGGRDVPKDYGGSRR